MIDVKAEFTGLDVMAKKFDGLTDANQFRSVLNALKSSVKPTLDMMRSLCPVGTVPGVSKQYPSRCHEPGNLKKSIKILSSKEGGKFPTVWVGPTIGLTQPDGWYALIVEGGHKNGKSYVPAQPYVRPSIDATQGSVASAAEAMIMNSIEQAWERL